MTPLALKVDTFEIMNVIESLHRTRTLIGHRFYMNLCHTVFSQAIFWKLLSRVTLALPRSNSPTEITDECCTTTTRRSSRVRDLDRFEASSLILLQPHFSALTAIISVFLTLLCLSYSAMENALLWMMWLLRRPNWRQTLLYIFLMLLRWLHIRRQIDIKYCSPLITPGNFP